MKFPLAAGLLAQTVPTLSRISDTNHLTTSEKKWNIQNQILVPHQPDRQRYNKRRGWIVQRKLGLQTEGSLKNAPNDFTAHRIYDPMSTNADTGILSCSEGHICQPESESVSTRTRQNAANLAEIASYVEGLSQCDPTLVDIGILACEEGKVCDKDALSPLGGFCFDPSVSSRRLNPMEHFYFSCEPSFANFYSSCDCSGMNYTTGTGTLYCFVTNATYHGLYECDESLADDSFWFTFEEWSFVEGKECYKFVVADNEEFCVTWYDNFAEPCYLKVNGEHCDYCDIDYSTFALIFDCSNLEGGTSGTSMVDVFRFLEKCYANQTYTCTNLCGEGFDIPESKHNVNVTLPGNEVISCGQLVSMEESALISDVDCPTYTTAAQSGCCVKSDLTVPSSNVDSSTPDASTVSDTADDAPSLLSTKCFRSLVSLAASILILFIDS